MIYQYKCEKQHYFEVIKPMKHSGRKEICPTCSSNAKKLVTGGIAGFADTPVNIPGVCTSLPGKPVYVKSKHHFRELCKERGTEPVGL